MTVGTALTDLRRIEKLVLICLLVAVSDAIVFFLRLLTSAQIRINPDKYMSFLINPDSINPVSISEFCQKSVEPMTAEAGLFQIHCLLLPAYMYINRSYSNYSTS